MLLIVSGPSGVGKTTLIADLFRRANEHNSGQLQLSVSYTTRTARRGERHGENYFFASRQQFAQMVADGGFLEHAEIYGERYGTPREEVSRHLQQGRHVLLEIDWQGAQQVRSSGIPQRSVFILPPGTEALRSRLAKRGLDKPEVVAKRIERATSEIDHAYEASHRITNEDFDRAADELYRWCFADRNGRS